MTTLIGKNICANNMDKKKIENYWFYIFFGIFILFLAYLCYTLNIWEDETYSLNTSSKGLKYALIQSFRFEGQPPLYFLILTLWRMISPTIFFSRLLSLIFFISGALVFRKLLMRHKILHAKLFTLLFLIMPYGMYFATEIRTYALLIFLSSLNLYYFSSIIHEKGNQRQYWVLFLINIMGMLSQYLFAVLIISQVLVLMKFRKPGIKNILILISPIIIVFLISFPFLFNQITSHQVENKDVFKDLLVKIGRTVQNMVFSFHKVPDKEMIKTPLKLVFLIFTGILVYLQFFKEKKDSEAIRIFLYLTTISLIGFYLFFILFQIRYFDKYLAVIYPLVLLMYFLSINTSWKGILKVFLIVFILYNATINIFNYSGNAKTYDYRGLVKFLNELNQEKAPVFVYRRALALSLSMYNSDSLQLVQVPYPIDYKQYQPIGIEGSEELLALVHEKLDEGEVFYVVSDDSVNYEYGVDLKRTIFNEALSSKFGLLVDTLYYGTAKDSYLNVKKYHSGKSIQ